MAERLGLGIIPGVGWRAKDIQMIAREAKKLLENEARALHSFLEAGKSVRPPALPPRSAARRA